LGGFTASGTKNGLLYVMEFETGHTFETSPKNVAVERDFNRVNIEGVPSDTIENALAPFEQKAVQAITNVSKTKKFPARADYILI